MIDNRPYEQDQFFKEKSEGAKITVFDQKEVAE
jgi:hypothetical protein